MVVEAVDPKISELGGRPPMPLERAGARQGRAHHRRDQTPVRVPERGLSGLGQESDRLEVTDSLANLFMARRQLLIA